MALIHSPWSRVCTPPAIPEDITTAALSNLDDLQFAELIRAHLVPREQNIQDRQHWERF